MAITLQSSTDRVRERINDPRQGPDGQVRPDIRYSDADIQVEIKRALLELLESEPNRFYPHILTGAALIDALAPDGVMPIQQHAVPKVELRAQALLESTDTEGIRPEVAQQVAATAA